MEVTIKIRGGNGRTPLSVIRPYGMDVLPNGALDINESLYMTNGLPTKA